MMSEATNVEWFDLPEELCFSNYEITKDGKIRNKKSGYILQRKPSTAGYIEVLLVKDDGKLKSIFMHRLVAMTFLGIPNNKSGLTVDHINRIGIDNRLENLRWANRSEQALNQTKPEYKKSRAIYQLNDDLEIINKWNSVKEAATYFNLKGTSGIYAVCKGTLKSAAGFKWQYCDIHDGDLEGEIWDQLPEHLDF